jgi:hypothetical protein
MFNAKAFRLALGEFALMFVVEVVWNYFRKNGVSVVDAFGVALITAVFLYCVHLPRE